MKQSVLPFLVLVLLASAPAVSHAQTPGGMKGMAMKDTDMKGMESAKKDKGALHKGVGVVKNVDAKAGTVSLSHEPIKSMNWSAMTMTFAVKDKNLLDKLQSGKKVEFEFVQQGKEHVITDVK